MQSHRRLQQAMRKFVQEHIYPDAQVKYFASSRDVKCSYVVQAREEDGKRPSISVVQKMA